MQHPMISLLTESQCGQNPSTGFVVGDLCDTLQKPKKGYDSIRRGALLQDPIAAYSADEKALKDTAAVCSEESRGMAALRQLSAEVESLENMAGALETKLGPLLADGGPVLSSGRLGPVGESVFVRVVSEHSNRLSAIRARLEDLMVRYEI